MSNRWDQQGLRSPTSGSSAPIPFGELFSNGKTVELMSIRRVAEWFKAKGPGQLRLPPIQRSFVWRNEQIINYWDSLMRGYPAGMMMVTRADQRHCLGRGLNGRTEPLVESGFHLFDGQQRMLSLLLGLGEGILCESLRLWVDIGQIPNSSEDRLFVLRMNSTGQPFGYKPKSPNEKMSVADRRSAHEEWPEDCAGRAKPPDAIFREMQYENTGKLGSATCAIPLGDVTAQLMVEGREKTSNEIRSRNTLAVKATEAVAIDDLLGRLEKALEAEIIVKLVDGAVLDEENYRRFFVRLGQGGTRLSENELVYSLIKDRYPYMHNRLEDIVNCSGRLASEVDLVLGALRVAQALAPWPHAEEWHKAGRPTPERVQLIDDKGRETTKPYFLSMLPGDETAPPKLQNAIQHLKKGLIYDQKTNPTGLPSMLLARLPRDLLDVLVLFAFKRGQETTWEGNDRATLIAFVLHWLHFVGSDEKAAYDTFVRAGAEEWRFGESSTAALLVHFETTGVARYAPRAKDWVTLEDEVRGHGCALARWGERFSSSDVRDGPSPGEALRVLSDHSEIKRRALIWIQRHYVARAFPHYDPTSTRDDDLPFDLDHIIPHELFGFHWTDARKPQGLSKPEETLFRDMRQTVGNSLGNLRWLAASDNRGRGMGQVECVQSSNGDESPFDDYIDRPSWNTLINENGSFRRWNGPDVATFQRLIDTRTLLLSKLLIEQSGVSAIVGVADSLNTPAHNDA